MEDDEDGTLAWYYLRELCIGNDTTMPSTWIFPLYPPVPSVY
jgi:hypothetical protein